MFFGRWPWPWPGEPEEGAAPPRYWGLRLILPVLFVFGLVTAAGRGRAGRALDRRQRLVVGFLCFNIAYVALAGNLLELGENNRFRAETDPLSLVLLGVLVEGTILPWWRRRGRS